MNQKEIFLISLTIFFTIIAWIMVEAYKVDMATKMEKEKAVKVVKSIKIDTGVFNVLKEKN